MAIGTNIGDTPQEITTLSTYASSASGSINTGAAIPLSDYELLTRPVLLTFVNVYYDEASFGETDYAAQWFAALADIQSSGACQVYVVAFKHQHDGNGYIAPTGGFNPEVKTYVAAHGSHIGFAAIPVAVDPGGAGCVSETMYYGDDAAMPVTWSYLIEANGAAASPYFRICDRWHPNTPADGPISFKHLDLADAFDASDAASVSSHVLARAANLTAALRILKANPAAGSYIKAASDVISVALSRPIADLPLASPQDYFLLEGGGVPGGGPIKPTAGTPAYSYAANDDNFKENVIALDFPAAGAAGGTLTDAGDDDTVTLSIDPAAVADWAGTAIADSIGINTVAYSVDFTGPAPTLGFVTGSACTNVAPTIELLLDFHEDVQNFLPTQIVPENATMAVPGALTTPGQYRILLTPVPTPPGATAWTITLRVAAGAAEDLRGNPSSAMSDLVIAYDIAPPIPAISAAISGSTMDLPSGSVLDSDRLDITVDFGEETRGAETPGSVGHELDASGIQLTGGCSIVAGTFSHEATHRRYSFTVQLLPNAAATIAVLAGQVLDLAGNPNAASASAFAATFKPKCDHDLVLLIDLSNSMNWDVTIGGVRQAKILFMRPVIRLFLEKLKLAVPETAKGSDQVGLVRYGSSASVLQAIPGSVFSRLDALDGAIALVGGLAAAGNTALGAGLANALKLVDHRATDAAHGRKRFIVLFADGQDNVEPYVTALPYNYAIPDPGANLSSGYPAGYGPISVLASDSDKTRITTIGIPTEGETGAWLDKLRLLSEVSGGTDHATESQQIWPDVEFGLDSVLAEAYDGQSPQIVHQAAGELPPQTREASHPFLLDRGVHSITISVSWPGDAAMRFSLYKGGRRITSFRGYRRDPSFVVTAVDFPIALKASGSGRERIGPEGEWDLRVSRVDDDLASGAPFSVSVIAEEYSLKAMVESPSSPSYVGSPILVGLRVFDGGRPVGEIARGGVRVERHRFGFGDLVRKHEKPIKRYLKDIKNPTIQDVIAALRKIPDAAEALSARQTFSAKFLNVKEAGRAAPGNFAASIDNTAVPGIYRLDCSVAGFAPSVGAFQRQAIRTILVLPRLAWKRSLLSRTTDPRTRRIVLELDPQDAKGTLLGPGFAASVGTAGVEGPLVASVTDELDGRYRIELDPVAAHFREGGAARVTMAGGTVLRLSPADPELRGLMTGKR